MCIFPPHTLAFSLSLCITWCVSVPITRRIQHRLLIFGMKSIFFEIICACNTYLHVGKEKERERVRFNRTVSANYTNNSHETQHMQMKEEKKSQQQKYR